MQMMSMDLQHRGNEASRTDAAPQGFPLDDARHPSHRSVRMAIMDQIAANTPNTEARAIAIAAFAHAHQLRRSGEPYIVHLLEVMKIVSELPNASVAKKCGAVLHDIVEDGAITGVLLEDVRRWFDAETAEIVDGLTDVSVPSDGNRATRKAIDRAHSAAAPAEVQDIKLGDNLSNLRNIVDVDPKFAAVYLPEKHAQASELTKGDARLRMDVLALIDEQMQRLKAVSASGTPGLGRKRV